MHITCPTSNHPLCSLLTILFSSFSLPRLAPLFRAISTFSPSPPPSPTQTSCLNPHQRGVVNAMSFLSLSAERVASAGDELPVDSFVFAEHSDSQCRVIPPELATCENSPFGRPLFRWVSNHQKANQSKETGNQGPSLCCAQPSTAGLAIHFCLFIYLVIYLIFSPLFCLLQPKSVQ